MTQDSNHEELIMAYLEYVKANELWERRKSVRTYAAVQRQLKRIRNLAIARNKENRTEFQLLNPEKRMSKQKKYK